jgi:hypothetical protein
VGEQKDTVTVETINPQLESKLHTIDQVSAASKSSSSRLTAAVSSTRFPLARRRHLANYQGDYNRAMDVSILGGDRTVRASRWMARASTIRLTARPAELLPGNRSGIPDLGVFDPLHRITAAGAINIVTRSGSNQLHGSGFFFFRDHHMAAYPGLQRDPLAPDLFFAPQSGPVGGGPVVKDRSFSPPTNTTTSAAFHSVRIPPSTVSRASRPAPSMTTWSTPASTTASAPPTPPSCATPTMATTPSRRAKSTPCHPPG